MKKTHRTTVGPAMRRALAYIALRPGTTAAKVDRACRTARGGHKWMYATIQRLERAGLVTRTRTGRGIELALAATPAGLAYLAGAP